MNNGYEASVQPIVAKDYVAIPLSEYRELVDGSARGDALANAFMKELELSSYGPTADAGNLIAVFRALYPDDYEMWLEAAKRQEAEGENEV